MGFKSLRIRNSIPLGIRGQAIFLPLRVPQQQANLAERVGFEPTVPLARTTVFETAPFDHSGTSPWSYLAEREGFEPSVESPLHTISSRAPSATRTPLQTFSLGLPPACTGQAVRPVHPYCQRAPTYTLNLQKKSLRTLLQPASKTPRRTRIR